MAKNEFDELMSIGIDIGKDTFHLVGFDQAGQRVLRKQIKRLALVATFEELPRCVVGMEACLSAHFVSRTLRKLGFEPRNSMRPNGTAHFTFGTPKALNAEMKRPIRRLRKEPCRLSTKNANYPSAGDQLKNLHLDRGGLALRCRGPGPVLQALCRMVHESGSRRFAGHGCADDGRLASG